MKREAIYKCKFCGAIIYTDEAKMLSDSTFDGIFNLDKPVCFVQGLPDQYKEIVHRCSPDVIGDCEFIGWRREE